MTRYAVALAFVAGCLEVPSGPGKECVNATDCDSGEVCTEGLCYGAPPAGTFAATLSAPTSRDDLVSAELSDIQLPADGWLGDIALESPVTISGRVEAYCETGNQTCSTQSIAAQVRLTRPSRIPGVAALRFSTQSKPDIPRGTDSFTIRVPRTRDGDAEWTVTIDPDGGADAPAVDGGIDPAEIVPPMRLSLAATDDLEHQTYTLGGPNQQTIYGTLRDAYSNTLAKYRVVALGRWEGESNLTEISTVDFSTDGTYVIHVAGHVMAPLTIVARPFEENDISPAIYLGSVDLTSGQRNLTQPSGLGQRRMIDIPVQALAGDGEVKTVSGVRVIVSGVAVSGIADDMRAIFTAETTTSEDGVAHLALLDGPALAATYVVHMVPPASSSYGIIYDGRLELASPVAVRLPARVALRGTVADAAGVPLAAVSVTARRSPRFLWSLGDADQSFLDEIPAPTALTTEAGEFVLWVDPVIADTWASYDLFFDPPAGSLSPSWWVRDQRVPRVASPGTVDLSTVFIPDAARLHATIVDASGIAVEGSALRIFQIYSNETVCMEVGHSLDACTPAAIDLGHSESDDHGKLRLTLPRP